MVIFSTSICVKPDRCGLKKGVWPTIYGLSHAPMKKQNKNSFQEKVILQNQNKLPSLFWSKKTDWYIPPSITIV